MRFPIRLLIIPFTFLFTYCSTVKPPITSTIPQDTVQISKTIAEKQDRSLKRKVAIARFSNETNYGKGIFSDLKEDRVGKQAMDILSAKLTSTDKFILLERIDLDHLTKEKEIANLNNMNIPADYLILGSVVEFGRKTTSDVGIFNRTKKQTAYAKVNVRLVDVKTGRIIYSEEGDGEAFVEAETVLGIGNTAEYDATLNDKVISAAISKLVNNIVEKLLDTPWQSYLLSFDEGNYIIAGGTLQGIKEGDVFSVYKRGSKVLNPQTNMEIELPGKFVGRIRVDSTVPGDALTELSMCSKLSGDIPIKDFGNYYIQEK